MGTSFQPSTFSHIRIASTSSCASRRDVRPMEQLWEGHPRLPKGVNMNSDDIFNMSIPEPNTGCWLWLQGATGAGYGVWHPSGTVHKAAHVLSYELANGPVPRGLMVRHTCDVRLCVNPDHLVVGTPAQNTQDAIRRGRFKAIPVTRGEGHYKAKLTDVDVLAIRDDDRSSVTLAAQYGVRKQTILAIKARKTWKHI